MKTNDKIREAVKEILQQESETFPMYEGDTERAVPESNYDVVVEKVVKFISFNFPVMRSVCSHRYDDFDGIVKCIYCGKWSETQEQTDA